MEQRAPDDPEIENASVVADIIAMVVKEHQAEPTDPTKESLRDWKRRQRATALTNQNNEKRVRAAKKKRDALNALELYARGVSADQIAGILGFKSRVSVHKAIREVVKEVGIMSLDDLRQIQSHQLMMMFSRLWDDGASVGKPRHVEVATKVLERQARLLGLDHSDRKDDQPKVDVTLVYDVHPKEQIQQAQQLPEPKQPFLEAEYKDVTDDSRGKVPN